MSNGQHNTSKIYTITKTQSAVHTFLHVAVITKPGPLVLPCELPRDNTHTIVVEMSRVNGTIKRQKTAGEDPHTDRVAVLDGLHKADEDEGRTRNVPNGSKVTTRRKGHVQ